MPVNKNLKKIFKNKTYLTADDAKFCCLFISIFSQAEN